MIATPLLLSSMVTHSNPDLEPDPRVRIRERVTIDPVADRSNLGRPPSVLPECGHLMCLPHVCSNTHAENNCRGPL